MTKPVIVTITGKIIDYINPSIDQICIEDIAYNLSFINRWCGGTIVRYSVAEHSINCAKMSLAYDSKNKEQALYALLHDAAETYTSDIPRPFHRAVPDFKRYEKRLMDLIRHKFKLDEKHFDKVVEIDNKMLTNEAEQILSSSMKESLSSLGFDFDNKFDKFIIKPFKDGFEAMKQFSNLYFVLTGERVDLEKLASYNREYNG